MFRLRSIFGSRLAPLPSGNSVTAVYAAGTAYSLTNSAALLDFGTTDPSLTLTEPGTYLLLARTKIDYTGATFAAVRTVTIKLRRTNNTASDLTNGASTFLTDIITALTYTAGTIFLPPIIYMTSNFNDNIQLFGSINTVPTAGSIDISEAEIVAIKIA